VDTRGLMARVEGRNPHWVTPYAGERFSLIYYRTEGTQDPHEKFTMEKSSPWRKFIA
jgi:hypothetical protein